MNSRCGRTIAVIAATLTLVVPAVNVGGVVGIWDVATDFQTTGNPPSGGAWTYGNQALLGAALNPFNNPWQAMGLTGWNMNSSWSMGSVWKYPGSMAFYSTSFGAVEPGRFYMTPHQGNQFTTTRWTAPAGLCVRVVGEFWGAAAYDPLLAMTTTDVHILKSDVSVFDAVIDGFAGLSTPGLQYSDPRGATPAQPFDFTTVVQEGDTIDFCVGYGPDQSFAYDTTGLAATIAVDQYQGIVTGTVRSASVGNPALAGVTVEVVGTGLCVLSGSDGSYSLSLPPGSYAVQASKSGYVSEQRAVVIAGGARIEAHFVLPASSGGGGLWGRVFGEVGGSLVPVPGARVEVVETGASVVAGFDARYYLALAPGTYTLAVSGSGFRSAEIAGLTVDSSGLIRDVFLNCSTSFDVAADFSGYTSSGPIWSYGSRANATGVFTHFNSPWTQYQLLGWNMSGPDWSYGSNWINPTDSVIRWTGLHEPGRFYVHPGISSASVVRWTAPVSGDALIRAAFNGATAPVTTSVQVGRNGVTLFSGRISGYSGEASKGYADATGSVPAQVYADLVPVATGDRIEFAVGNEGQFGSDSTGLMAMIDLNPPPVVHAARLSAVKCVEPGTPVRVTQAKVVTVDSPGSYDGSFYIQEVDRSCGMRAVCRSPLTVRNGDRITFAGVVTRDEYTGEKLVSVSSIASRVPYAPAKPLGVSHKGIVSSDSALVGLLVRVCGQVTYVEPTRRYFRIDDGSGIRESANSHKGVRVSLLGVGSLCAVPAVGSQVAVTGVLTRCAGGFPTIRPRSGSDLTALSSGSDGYRFYVSNSGSDTWSGTIADPSTGGNDGPFATLERARDAIRQIKAQPGGLNKPATVYLRGGTYHLQSPFTLTPEDSGYADAPITYTAYPGEPVTISGGRTIRGFAPVEVNGRQMLCANIPDVANGNWYFRQLFVNDIRRPRPRLPRTGYYTIAGLESVPENYMTPQDRFYFNPGEIVSTWHNVRDVDVRVFHFWVGMNNSIGSVDDSSRLLYLAKPSRRRLTEDFGMSTFARYYVENVYEALDTPGQWYLDRPTGVLYYYPCPGETAEDIEVIAPRMEKLVMIQGASDASSLVSYIRFRNLRFSHTEHTLPPDNAGDIYGAMEVPGAIEMVGAYECVVENCDIQQIGTYAVEITFGSTGCRVERCRMQDLGAGGVKVRWGFTHTVADNEITGGGKVFAGGVGVLIANTPNNQVVHNHIHDFCHVGVSVGWVWGYGNSFAVNNTIAWNHIHDVGQQVLSDLGGVYTLGVSPGTTITHNLIYNCYSYSYGGWGIYTDEGSSDIVIERNIVYNTKTGGFHQHYGRENVVRNNIFAFSQGDQIQRTKPEEHISFRFLRNIVYYNQGAAIRNGNNANWTDNNFVFDYNTYWDASGRPVTFAEGTLDQWRQRGHDLHSTIADPLFVDPDNYDFTLREGSPVLDMGFEPIDLSGVGPRALVGPQ